TPNVVPQRNDPTKLFADVFGGIGGGVSGPAGGRVRAPRRRRARPTRGGPRRLAALRGAARKTKNERPPRGGRAHQQAPQPAGSTMEKRRALGAPATGCKTQMAPPAGDYTRDNANPLIPNIIRSQMDITVAAMSCDLTRVSSMLWTDSGNVRWVWSWLGPQFS